MRKTHKYGCSPPPYKFSRSTWHARHDIKPISEADLAERVRIEARHSETPVWRRAK